MRPGREVRPKTPAGDRVTARSPSDVTLEPLVSLSDDQRRLIDVLQTRAHGTTVRQLETTLSQPRAGIELLLESLLERQLVARLNTVIPSYVYRYGGLDLPTD